MPDEFFAYSPCAVQLKAQQTVYSILTTRAKYTGVGNICKDVSGHSSSIKGKSNSFHILLSNG